MNIAIKMLNKMELTDAIKSYVEKKLKGLERIITSLKEEPTIFVEIGKTSKRHKSGDIFKAEVRTTLCGISLYATSLQSDLYAAIDDVKDEIEAEAEKLKAKKQTIQKKGGQKLKKLIKRTK